MDPKSLVRLAHKDPKAAIKHIKSATAGFRRKIPRDALVILLANGSRAVRHAAIGLTTLKGIKPRKK